MHGIEHRQAIIRAEKGVPYQDVLDAVPWAFGVVKIDEVCFIAFESERHYNLFMDNREADVS